MSLSHTLPTAFKARCEAIATDERRQLGLRAFDRLPASMLANRLRARVTAPQEVPSLDPVHVAHLLGSDTWSAAIVSREPLWIVYHPAHSAKRRESDLMHELAHVLLNHQPDSIDGETGMLVINRRQEQEASYLGGCLQIPRRGMLWAAQRCLTASQVSEHFGASEAMVRFRCQVTGVRLAGSNLRARE